MKYMKLGVLPDTFFTEEAVRTVLSDAPPDLNIQINNVKYQLHKCGLLQRLCSDTSNSDQSAPIHLHDIPGGEEAFELCAKFCYGISIRLSAHNFVPAICAAKYLRMAESTAKGNLVMKLDSFFNSCILQGWKDPIVVLQETRKVISWSENFGIVSRCIDTVIQKILTHPSKVTWSYTYTRPGYDKQPKRPVPRDWWTEDVSDLDLDLFRAIISSVRSSKQLPPPLIGEALHVYACKNLEDPSEPLARNSGATTEETITKQRCILECIVGMIPSEYSSVSGKFILSLLKTANYIGVSPSTKAELIRMAGHHLHEVTAKDLLLPSPSNSESCDTNLVEAILEIFLIQYRRPMPEEETSRMMASMIKVSKTIDSYLQEISCKQDVPVSKIVELARSLPELARPKHDGLYHAIDIYLKEHPGLSKAEKKHLCQMLDCRKLSHEMRLHAIRNDLLPVRTIVQVLFIEQEKLVTRNQGTPRTSQGFREMDHKEQSIKFSGMGKSKSRSDSRINKKKGKETSVEEGQGSNSKDNR